jgi:hypothetical protein
LAAQSPAGTPAGFLFDGQREKRPQDDHGGQAMRMATRWILALGVAIIAALYLSGFCFSGLRYVSRSELIAQALLERARYIKGMPAHATRAQALAYLRENPACCRVEGANFFLANSLLDRVFGLSTTWVRVVYRLTDERAAVSPADGEYYEAFVGISRCGHPVNAIGQRLTEAQFRSL